jgi:hypothetical protein
VASEESCQLFPILHHVPWRQRAGGCACVVFLQPPPKFSVGVALRSSRYLHDMNIEGPDRIGLIAKAYGLLRQCPPRASFQLAKCGSVCMYVCIYVCMLECMQVRVHLYVCTYMYAYMDASTHAGKYMYMCLLECMSLISFASKIASWGIQMTFASQQ